MAPTTRAIKVEIPLEARTMVGRLEPAPEPTLVLESIPIPGANTGTISMRSGRHNCGRRQMPVAYV
jgi:hypothetical protein